MKKRTLVKTLLFAGAIALIFTAVMGFAHTKAGRPVLTALGKLLGKKEFCPLGYDHVATFEEREEKRRARALIFASRAPAASRKILDFEFGRSTRQNVLAWFTARGGTCRDAKSPAELDCQTGSGELEASTYWLEFDRNQMLVGSRGVASFTAKDEAWRRFESLFAEARSKKEVERSGPTSPDELSGLLAQSVAILSFSNFNGSYRVSNMGNRFVITHDLTAF